MKVVHTSNTTRVEKIFGAKKLGNPTFSLFYGVEMEYEVPTPSVILTNPDTTEKFIYREQAAWPLQKSIDKFAIIKHDGSLKNGFEVVTIPMSLEEHKFKWDDFFTITPKANIEVKTTCGMHVHASKEMLTPFQIGKILVFIFSKQNFPFIRLMAGRIPPVKFSEIAPKKIGDVNKHKIRKSSLNLTNPETIEFRFFKSTLNKQILFKNIEFCDALIRFTWPGICGYDLFIKDGVQLFCQYVKDNKSVYPNLYEFLGKIKYLKTKRRGRPRKYKSDLDNFEDNIGIIKPKRKVIKAEKYPVNCSYEEFIWKPYESPFSLEPGIEHYIQ
jgi:hypothetical protein